MKFLSFLYKASLRMNSRSIRYDIITRDNFLRERSVRFGLYSIFSSIFGLICAVGGVALIFALKGLKDPILFVLALLFAIGLILTALDLFIVAVIDLIYQSRINKRGIRIAALVIFILSLIGAAAGVIFTISLLNS